jgi:hypothetical protein
VLDFNYFRRGWFGIEDREEGVGFGTEEPRWASVTERVNEWQRNWKLSGKYL